MDGSKREPPDIVQRKRDHLRIVAAGQGRARDVTTGLERIRFEHCALPELDLDGIDLTTRFLGKDLRAPFLISSMTGGPAEADAINRHIAEAAQALGIAFAVGSQRVAIAGHGSEGLAELRRRAPGIPILANLGGAQIAREYGLAEAERAVEMIGADALIIHLNPLQEAVQAEGDRDWRGVLAGVERLASRLSVPLIAKEVGFGISVPVARRLADAGAYAIDVAGAGGTSWAAVEAGRAPNARVREIAEAFAGWGIPTAIALADIRAALPDIVLIGSGGVRDGIDAARAIRLGADLVGQAAGVLAAARDSTEALVEHLEVAIEQLRIVCFCTGSRDLAALRKASLLPQ